MIRKEKLIQAVAKITKTDPLSKSRETLVVEVRSMINHILNSYYGMGCTQISRFYKQQGRYINHATVLHSLRMWEVYSKDKNCAYLNDWLHDVLGEIDSSDEVKKSYIKTKIDFVEHEPLNKVYKQVKKEYAKYLNIEEEEIN